VPVPGNVPSGTTQELIARGVVQAEQLKNHPLVQARVLEGLGRIYENAVQIADANLAYERSLALRRANGAGESAEAATTLLHLANTLRITGSYAAADSAAWEALHIYEKLNGPSDPSTADGWQMLSMLAVYRSDLRASESYARRSVDIRAAAYGADDPRLAYAVEMLGLALRRIGRYDEGERYMRQAITLYERDKGPNDVILVVPLYRLADVAASDHEDYAEAARLMERGLAISKATLGEGHQRTAYALEFLGGLESRRGNFAKAERLSRLAVEIFDRKVGKHDVALADAYADLAKVYSRAGRWSDAEATQRTAISVYESALGRAHSAYGAAIGGLCEIHVHAGRLAEAETECRDMLAIRGRALGTTNLGLTNPLMLLGDIRVQRGELAAADSFYSSALAIIREHADQPRAYESLYPRMAVLRDLQHRPAEAAELRKKAGGKPVRSLDF
jgi:tetratricopeptide (TPR) repeat protein